MSVWRSPLPEDNAAILVDRKDRSWRLTFDEFTKEWIIDPPILNMGTKSRQEVVDIMKKLIQIAED